MVLASCPPSDWGRNIQENGLRLCLLSVSNLGDNNESTKKKKKNSLYLELGSIIRAFSMRRETKGSLPLLSNRGFDGWSPSE